MNTWSLTLLEIVIQVTIALSCRFDRNEVCQSSSGNDYSASLSFQGMINITWARKIPHAVNRIKICPLKDRLRSCLCKEVSPEDSFLEIPSTSLQPSTEYSVTFLESNKCIHTASVSTFPADPLPPVNITASIVDDSTLILSWADELQRGKAPDGYCVIIQGSRYYTLERSVFLRRNRNGDQTTVEFYAYNKIPGSDQKRRSDPKLFMFPYSVKFLKGNNLSMKTSPREFPMPVASITSQTSVNVISEQNSSSTKTSTHDQRATKQNGRGTVEDIVQEVLIVHGNSNSQDANGNLPARVVVEAKDAGFTEAESFFPSEITDNSSSQYNLMNKRKMKPCKVYKDLSSNEGIIDIFGTFRLDVWTLLSGILAVVAAVLMTTSCIYELFRYRKVKRQSDYLQRCLLEKSVDFPKYYELA